MSLCVALWVASIAAEDSMVTGEVQLIADGFQFTEGPVWLQNGRLAFSDIPADTIFLADKSVLHQPSGNSNGLVLDNEGRLIRCEHGNRRVARVEADGSVTTLAERYDGKRFNSPNDATVRSDGIIFFTDPPYGLGDRTKEIEVNGVYAIDPSSGDVKLIADDFDRPNGIALSPDDKSLYIADTQKGHVRAFDVAADGTLSNGRVHCEIGFPDGMAIDEHGNVWVTGVIEGKGVVAAFAPDGTRVAMVAFPQNPANCAFGGEDGQTLYATARTGVYGVATTVRGVQFARP